MFLHLCYILFTGEKGVLPIPRRKTGGLGVTPSQTPLDADPL